MSIARQFADNGYLKEPFIAKYKRVDVIDVIFENAMCVVCRGEISAPQAGFILYIYSVNQEKCAHPGRRGDSLMIQTRRRCRESFFILEGGRRGESSRFRISRNRDSFPRARTRDSAISFAWKRRIETFFFPSPGLQL